MRKERLIFTKSYIASCVWKWWEGHKNAFDWIPGRLPRRVRLGRPSPVGLPTWRLVREIPRGHADLRRAGRGPGQRGSRTVQRPLAGRLQAREDPADQVNVLRCIEHLVCDACHHVTAFLPLVLRIRACSKKCATNSPAWATHFSAASESSPEALRRPLRWRRRGWAVQVGPKTKRPTLSNAATTKRTRSLLDADPLIDFDADFNIGHPSLGYIGNGFHLRSAATKAKSSAGKSKRQFDLQV